MVDLNELSRGALAAAMQRTEFVDASQPEEAPCAHCGEPQLLELLEAWGPHDFMLDTCCEELRAEAAEWMLACPKEAAAWLQGQGLVGMPLRRVVDDGTSLILDFKTEIVAVEQDKAKAFVARHHRHCRAPVGWRFGAGVRNGPASLGDDLLGVVMVGRPVARMIDKNTVLEVNRLCLRDAGDLTWNAASQLYGWAARQTVRRGFRKIITYTRIDEPGTSLKAAGWVVEARVKGRHWTTRSRPREAVDEPIDKLRWTPAAMLGVPLRPQGRGGIGAEQSNLE